MYGFPTQTVQDTVGALEYARQRFGGSRKHVPKSRVPRHVIARAPG